MVENSGHYLCNDTDRQSIIERLIALDDQSQDLDTALEDISVWDKVTDTFTVGGFFRPNQYLCRIRKTKRG